MIEAAARNGQALFDGVHYRLPNRASGRSGEHGATRAAPVLAWAHHGRFRGMRIAGQSVATPVCRQTGRGRHVSPAARHAADLSATGVGPPLPRRIWQKRIVLVGDDDLTSLAMALVGGYESLHVLEIDPRLIAFLQARIGDAANVIQWDAHNSVPPSLAGAADTFFCDPSRPHDHFFLRRGLELASPNGALYFCANPSHTSEVEFGPFLSKLHHAGLILDGRHPALQRLCPDQARPAPGVCRADVPGRHGQR